LTTRGWEFDSLICFLALLLLKNNLKILDLPFENLLAPNLSGKHNISMTTNYLYNYSLKRVLMNNQSHEQEIRTHEMGMN
jgi:hypothetical protein